jgi:hypothetical protein
MPVWILLFTIFCLSLADSDGAFLLSLMMIFLQLWLCNCFGGPQRNQKIVIDSEHPPRPPPPPLPDPRLLRKRHSIALKECLWRLDFWYRPLFVVLFWLGVCPLLWSVHSQVLFVTVTLWQLWTWVKGWAWDVGLLMDYISNGGGEPHVILCTDKKGRNVARLTSFADFDRASSLLFGWFLAVCTNSILGSILLVFHLSWCLLWSTLCVALVSFISSDPSTYPFVQELGCMLILPLFTDCAVVAVLCFQVCFRRRHVGFSCVWRRLMADSSPLPRYHSIRLRGSLVW